MRRRLSAAAPRRGAGGGPRAGVRRARGALLRRRVRGPAPGRRRGRGRGVADYPSFAPAGWTPPSALDEAEHLRALLADERVWCLVAEAAGEPVGQVTILPASIAARPTDEPGLAHLRNLFVRGEHQGTGV